MDKRQQVAEEVRRTMELLDKLGRVQARPGFRQRVLDNPGPVSRSASFRWERSLSWAAVGLLLLLNTAVAYQRLSGGGTRSQLESALGERYGLGASYESYLGIK